MSKSLRLSERWFNRGLWIVAVLFGLCLIGLGGILVGDLPRVEHQAQRNDFIDQAAAQPLRQAIAQARLASDAAGNAGEQAALRLQAARKAYDDAKEAFGSWVETRKATNLPDQDRELVDRTKALDALNAARVAAQQAADAQNQAALDAQQAQTDAQDRLEGLNAAADRRVAAEQDSADLRVFGYRLALTLPLLALAVWLFLRKRRSTWWPFVWGFIFFALFTFFVELVPYLPSYGGYVHYGVGLLLTVFGGRYTIVALNRYIAQQKLIEQQPDRARRDELDYDTALTRMGKGVCPGCERPIDLKGGTIDFCPHCGICVYDHCTDCTARKNAFVRFCHTCGTPAHGLDAPGIAPTPAPA